MHSHLHRHPHLLHVAPSSALHRRSCVSVQFDAAMEVQGCIFREHCSSGLPLPLRQNSLPLPNDRSLSSPMARARAAIPSSALRRSTVLTAVAGEVLSHKGSFKQRTFVQFNHTKNNPISFIHPCTTSRDVVLLWTAFTQRKEQGVAQCPRCRVRIPRWCDQTRIFQIQRRT